MCDHYFSTSFVQMLFSASSPTIFWAVAIASGVATYTKGDFGDFCRAIGVGGLLLSQRTGFSKFLVKFVSQVGSLCRQFISHLQHFPAILV